MARQRQERQAGKTDNSDIAADGAAKPRRRRSERLLKHQQPISPSEDIKPTNEPAAEESLRPKSAKAPENPRNHATTSRGEVGASNSKYATRYPLPQQRESMVSPNPCFTKIQTHSRVLGLSGAASRSTESSLESNDENSDTEYMRDSDTEDIELYASVATTGSGVKDDPLNPAAAQFVVDLRPFGLRQIDRHTTIPTDGEVRNRRNLTRSPKSTDSEVQSPSILRFKQEKEPTSFQNVGSHFPRREGVIDGLSNVMSSWSVFETWLLSMIQTIYNDSCVQILLSRIYQPLLYWVSSLTTVIIAILVILALVLFFSPLIWLVVWAWDIPVNAIDHWTKDTCNWSSLNPICSYGCSISPWFVLYMFSDTCSHHVFRKSLSVDPFWQTTIASDEMNDIPWLIALRGARCAYYSARIGRICDSLPISNDTKDILRLTQDEVCSEIKHTSNHRSSYRRHVNILSAAVLRSVDIEQAQTPEASSYSMLKQHNKLNEAMRDLMTKWQKKHDYFLSPSQEMFVEVRESRRKIIASLKSLLHLQEETSRARTDKIKTWGLSRRAARGIGLLQSDPPELYGYNDALKLLEGCIAEIRSLVRLYTIIEIEIAKLDGELGKDVARRFAADVRFRLGPDGLLELYTYWMGHGSEAGDVGDLIDGARLIEREEGRSRAS